MTRAFQPGPMALAAGFCLLASTAIVEAREIKGELFYRERIALPDHAKILLEVRQGEKVLSELVAALGGAQVPLAFLLGVEAGPGQVLTGGVMIDGQVAWITPPIALPAEDKPVDLGPMMMKRYVSPGGFASAMDCGGTPAVVGFTGPEGAVLTVDGTTYVLAQTVTASGARFSDGKTPETVFWSKGDTALITVAGKDLPECHTVTEAPGAVKAPPATAGAILALPFVARGNEPGWVLNLTAEGAVLSREDGSRTDVAGLLPQPEPVGTGFRYRLSDDMALTVGGGICHDTMTGMPYPASVSLAQGDTTLAGCGGDPAALLNGEWTVTRIGEADVPAGIAVSMTFGDGHVSGSGGCNRFMGSYQLTGESLGFGELAGTLMACPDKAMAIEHTFHNTMGQIDHFDILDDGTLVLTAGDVALVTAVRPE